MSYLLDLGPVLGANQLLYMFFSIGNTPLQTTNLKTKPPEVAQKVVATGQDEHEKFKAFTKIGMFRPNRLTVTNLVPNI